MTEVIIMKIEFTVGEHTFNKGTEYEKTAKCAFVEGKAHRIQKSKEGYEYFEIENPYVSKTAGTTVENELARIFYNRICDAIRAVRDGYADALYAREGFFGGTSTTRPVVLIDRVKGEELRAKTLEGFKNSKFGYSIKFGSKNSMSGPMFVTETGLSGIFVDEDKVAFFPDYESAKTKVDEYIEAAKALATGKTPDELMEYFKNKDFEFRSVVNTLACEVCEHGVENIFENYKFDIVQNIR